MAQPDLSIYQNVRQPQMPNFLASLQQGEQYKTQRANRRLRTRQEKVGDKVKELYQSTGGDPRKIAQGIGMYDPETAQKYMGIADDNDQRKARAEKQQMEMQQTQQKEQMAMMGAMGSKYLQLDPQQKVQQFNSLRRTMRQYQIPEPENWREKTEYDQEVEADLMRVSSMGQSQRRTGTDYDAKLEYDRQKQGLQEQRQPNQLEQGKLANQQRRSEIAEGGLGVSRGKLGVQRQKLGIAEQDAELRKEKAVRATDKAIEAHQKQKLASANEITQINAFVDLAESIASSENLKYVTGIGRLLSWVPGTASADLNSDLDRLLSMGAIETMAKLKKESATGSTGFGALSEKELKTIQSSFSSINDPKQSPSKKRQELKRIAKTMRDYLKRIEQFKVDSPVKKSSTRINAKNGGKKNNSDKQLMDKYGF